MCDIPPDRATCSGLVNQLLLFGQSGSTAGFSRHAIYLQLSGHDGAPLLIAQPRGETEILFILRNDGLRVEGPCPGVALRRWEELLF